MSRVNQSKRKVLQFCGSSVIATTLSSLTAVLPTAAGARTAGASEAADYPTKAIQLFVGFAAGGGTDVMARLLAKKFNAAWGQPVYVTNRPGAGGNIASKLVVDAEPDGYTLLVAVSSLTINASLYKSMPFDTVRDLAPISMLSVAPNIIAANPSLPVRSVRDLLELARSKPGEISYGSPGSGQASHLAMELLATMAGAKFLHVPFNGGGPSITAVLGGQTQLVVGSLPTILPHVRSGRLRALGVTTAKRTSLAPDLPTIAEEADLPDYDANVWYGMLAPSGTPASIVNKLNGEIERTLRDNEVRDRFIALGFEPFHNSPQEFAGLIRSEIAKWEKVVRASGAKLD